MNEAYIYSLTDFSEIKHDGFDYVLPDKTLKIINRISTQVGSPGYIKTPVFRKNNKKRLNTIRNHPKIASGDWKQIRNFQKTKINKYTERIDKDINEIRNNLNKITDITYNTIKEDIMDKIEDIKEFMNEEYNIKLVECLIETGMSNKFYSQLYSDLLKDIIISDNSIIQYVEVVTDKMKDNFNSLESITSENDYDKFCDMNRILENEVSYYVFLSYMCCNEIYSSYKMKNDIETLISCIEEGLSSSSITFEKLNQYINIIYNVVPIIQNNKEFKNIVNKLNIVNRMKDIMSLFKKNKLITRKVLIKIMELLEKIS